jgi:F-type H+-transporting ATPase subunit a
VRFLVEGPPVTQPTVHFCGGPSFFCTVNVYTLVTSLICLAITVAVGLLVANRLSTRRPNKIQTIFEFLLDYMRGLIRQTVAEDALWILPIAMTIFFYILVANWLEFLPIGVVGLRPPTADLNQTAAMAVIVILVVQGYSIRVLGLRGYLRRFTKPFELNWGIRAPFVILNIIEELAKPLTLSLRLFGNLFGGLVMVYVIAVLLPQVPLPLVPTGIATVLLVVWKAFDVFFVGTLQAFIFMLLTIIYFGMAREGLEEEEHGRARPAERAAAGHARGASTPATPPLTGGRG